jgi:hypothetical protein
VANQRPEKQNHKKQEKDLCDSRCSHRNPVNPKTAAINATMKNASAQRNIAFRSRLCCAETRYGI